MPFDRPDLKTLISRVTADLNSRFSDALSGLRRRVNAVYARVLAGLAHGIYGHQEWISRQILPDTQDDAWLLRFGTMRGVIRKPASWAVGNIAVTGTSGAVIPAGTLWHKDDGTEYATTAEAVIAEGVATVTVAAVEAGAAANAEQDATVSIVSPIAGVNATAIVAAGGLAGGADIESIEAYRQRIVKREAAFITGANRVVYEIWAEEVAAVTRAWAYEATPAAGSLTVLFVCDDQEGGIVPNAAKIAEVAAYLEEHTDPATGQTVGRAVNVTLVVDAPAEAPIDFTIAPGPNTQAVKDAIAAELADLLRREAEPGGTIRISHIREAISVAAGEEDHVLTVPAADVTPAAGAIAVMGEITWA